VAFDGVNYLVVWNKFNENHDIYGARVTPGGQVLDEIPIFRAPGWQINPSIAFDGTNYLLAWQDRETEIKGTRVTTEGVILDPDGIAISTAPGWKSEPHLIFDGVNYFIVWADRRRDPLNYYANLDIYGARIKPDGTLLDGPSDTGGISINMAPLVKGNPRTTFDGRNYFVVWSVENYPMYPPAGIFGAKVSTDGFSLTDPFSIGIPLTGPPSCSGCRFVAPEVLYTDKALLTYVNNNEEAGSTKTIKGMFMLP
jgi:hypothetical protein